MDMIMEKDNLFSVRETPWHHKGIVIQDAPNADEALKIAHLDWNVVQTPIYYGKPGSNNKLQSLTAEGMVANVREDTQDCLGIVTSKYKPIQNKAVFGFMDKLLDMGARFETAGSLENGKRTWMLARLPDFNILGDDYNDYLLAANSFTGLNGLVCVPTKIRCVCNNTINLALKNAKRSWMMRHMGEDLNSKLLEATEALSLNNKYREELINYANTSVEKKISDSEFELFMNSLFPIESDDSNAVKAHMTKLQSDFITCYGAPDIAQFKGTEWGIIQAASDFAFHSAPLRSSDKFEEKKMKYVIEGHPFFDKAIDALNKRKVAA